MTDLSLFIKHCEFFRVNLNADHASLDALDELRKHYLVFTSSASDAASYIAKEFPHLLHSEYLNLRRLFKSLIITQCNQYALDRVDRRVSFISYEDLYKFFKDTNYLDQFISTAKLNEEDFPF